MKNRWFPILIVMPVVTGICGAILRAAQLTRAFDAETGVLKSGSPLTAALVAVSVIAVMMALISAFVLKNGVTSAPNGKASSIELFSTISAVLIIADAGVGIFGLRNKFDAVELIFSLLSVYCAVAIIVMGKYRMEERDSVPYSVFAAVPVFWACFLLILTFREKIADPIIADYAMLIFSYICILLFLYALAAHLLGRSRFAVMIFSCFVGMYFIIVELLSPVVAAFMMPSYDFVMHIDIRELLPQLALLVFMPSAASLIVRRRKQ